MSKKIIIPIAALFGLILLFIAAIVLVVFLGGFAYFVNSRTDTRPQSSQTVENKDFVDMTGATDNTHTFLAAIYQDNGVEGLRAWFDSNLKINGNVRTGIDANEMYLLKGVTYVRLSKTPTTTKSILVGEWGDAKSSEPSATYSISIFPTDNTKDALDLQINYREKIPTKN